LREGSEKMFFFSTEMHPVFFICVANALKRVAVHSLARSDTPGLRYMTAKLRTWVPLGRFFHNRCL
jgi:hypothetical protein